MKNSVLQKALSTALIAVVLTGVFPVSALNVEGQVNVSDGIGTSDIVLDAQAIQMDVSVNMYLPFTFDSQGTVYTATDATVINNSYGPVEITAVNATGQNGWSIVSKDTEWHKLAVDTKYLALSLNDDWADETGNIALNSPDWTVIDGNGGTLRYTYDGKIPAQSQALDEEAIGNIVWTIGWYEGEGTQEPEPEEPAETGYILLPPAVNEVTGYDGTSRVDVVIPATVMDEGVQKNVEVIGAMTFQNKPITGITIPETTKTIKGYAFTGCVQMTTVRINSTNVVIENDAFSTCPKITDVYFAGTQEQWEALSIGTGNDTLKSATIHYGEGEEIPSPSIHEHNWLSTWANDETYHWHECSADGCDIVNNSEKNGYAEHVYDDEYDKTCNICGYEREVELPKEKIWLSSSNVNDITGWDGTSQTTVVIPAITTYGGTPKTVAGINSGAFNRVDMTGVVIPETITNLSWQNFYKCNYLSTVYIKSVDIVVDSNAFEGCYDIANVYYVGNEEQWKALSIGSNNGSLDTATIHYNWNGKLPSEEDNKDEPVEDTIIITSANRQAITGYDGTQNELIIPSTYNDNGTMKTVVGIDTFAFSTCPSLTSVSIPETIKSIGRMSFYDCENLINLTINSTDLTIGSEAFSGPYDVNEGIYPVYVKYIYFSGTMEQWNKISSPDLKRVGSGVRCSDGDIPTPFAITASNKNEFVGTAKDVIIPSTVIDNGFIRPVEIVDELAYNTSSITSVVFPESIKEIRFSAFNGSSALSKITFNCIDFVIANGAFGNLNSLTDVYYAGTIAQWGALNIGAANQSLLEATIHCSDGDI